MRKKCGIYVFGGCSVESSEKIDEISDDERDESKETTVQ